MAETQANKIEYGLTNVYYAVIETESAESITYGNPKRIPGAVSLTLDPEQNELNFYADNTTYYANFSNNGYSGTMSFARITDEFKVDCLGFEKIGGLIVEKSTALSKPFALMFQFEGDKKAVRHVVYYNVAGRPSVASETKSENIEPKTQEITVKALPRTTDDIVKASTNETTSDEIYNGWFTKVPEPVDLGH